MFYSFTKYATEDHPPSFAFLYPDSSISKKNTKEGDVPRGLLLDESVQ